MPPDFPKGALGRGATASVDIVGRVRLDGTFGDPDIRATPDDPEFRKAVQDVIRHWLFWPAIDGATCESREVEAQARVWFEVAGGEPRVSVSFPRAELHAKAMMDPEKRFELYGIMPLEREALKYPREAIYRRIRQARVIALMRVESDGTVSKVTAAPTYAHVSFLSEAKRALSQWKFRVNPDKVKPGESVCASAVLDFRLVD